MKLLEEAITDSSSCLMWSQQMTKQPVMCMELIKYFRGIVTVYQFKGRGTNAVAPFTGSLSALSVSCCFCYAQQLCSENIKWNILEIMLSSWMKSLKSCSGSESSLCPLSSHCIYSLYVLTAYICCIYLLCMLIVYVLCPVVT